MNEPYIVVDPLVTAMREHPFFLDMYRRRTVLLQGDTKAEWIRGVFNTVDGDIESWVTVGADGNYEYWSAERGNARLMFRSNSVTGVITALIDGSDLASVNDLVPGCPYHEAPADIVYSTPNDYRGVARWADGEWIEFHGYSPLLRCLTFARLLRAYPRTIELRMRTLLARPGGGYSQRRSCLPHTGTALKSQVWRQWLAADPPCHHEGARPI